MSYHWMTCNMGGVDYVVAEGCNEAGFLWVALHWNFSDEIIRLYEATVIEKAMDIMDINFLLHEVSSVHELIQTPYNKLMLCFPKDKAGFNFVQEFEDTEAGMLDAREWIKNFGKDGYLLARSSMVFGFGIQKGST